VARLPRLSVPGVPHLLLWRGNNRQSVFLDTQDRQFFVGLLESMVPEAQVQLHAYLLLDNEVQLLATPALAQSLPQLMQALGRRYVRRFNLKHGRSGTLWEGRYRCGVLEAEPFLLPCMVGMDTQPVRTGLVNAPEHYPWSSHAHYIGLRHERGMSVPPQYWALGNTPFAREAAYAALARQGVSEPLWQRISEAAAQGWALGGPTFLEALGQVTERRLTKRKAGRPRAASARGAGDAIK